MLPVNDIATPIMRGIYGAIPPLYDIYKQAAPMDLMAILLSIIQKKIALFNNI
jgi:hypothetical protein